MSQGHNFVQGAGHNDDDEDLTRSFAASTCVSRRRRLPTLANAPWYMNERLLHPLVGWTRAYLSQNTDEPAIVDVFVPPRLFRFGDIPGRLSPLSTSQPQNTTDLTHME
uniref:Uncharacterized protein n=1 Tax=Minutocellus polymorphus TaxID=265543 RepID=A0A6U0K6F7_9STRA|mmetsp:Transcript_3387/g.5849  ORF Transcript_3387/g.5849 Transcript_3387/m.5849 type:complete len:109 (+) Transcript_3387:394-720(+)